MGRVLRNCSLAAVFVLFTGAFASAQLSTAQLSGRVSDESGAVLPGATITVTQTETGFTRTDVTDADGAYVLPNLPPGPYRLEVMLQGFRTYVQTGIVLQVAAAPVINAALAVGAVEESVTVQGAAPLVDVQSSGISEVVRNEEILALPLNGRNAVELVAIAGAAVQVTNAPTRAVPGGMGISVAGGQSFGVAYLLDGAMHNNPQDNLSLPFPFPDALQEFSVATSGLNAQHGMHAGAAVNAVTKSGTNRITGNAFEFLRDRRFNATNPFAQTGPDGQRVDDGLRRNQFGATIGGPIARDRAFFFLGYEALVERLGRTISTVVPDDNARNGILPSGPVSINPAVAPYLAEYPRANGPSLGQGLASYTFPFNQRVDEHFAQGRFDYSFGGGNQFFARYTFDDTDQFLPTDYPQFPRNFISRKFQKNARLLTGSGARYCESRL